MSLLLTLNIFHTLFYWFYCYLWPCDYRLGMLILPFGWKFLPLIIPTASQWVSVCVENHHQTVLQSIFFKTFCALIEGRRIRNNGRDSKVWGKRLRTMKLLTIHPTHLFYWRRKLSPDFFSTVALFNCLSFFPEFNTSFNFFKVIRSHMNRWFPQVDMNPFCLTLNQYVSGTRMIATYHL